MSTLLAVISVPVLPVVQEIHMERDVLVRISQLFDAFILIMIILNNSGTAPTGMPSRF